MGYCKTCVNKYGDWAYLLFRVLVGVMFFLHGYDKIFVKGMALGSLMGAAGLIELLAGIGIFFGILTRLVAVIAAVEMLIAYFKVHVGNGLSPLANGGELSLLFFAAFLVLAIYGAKKWCLEKKLWKKELF